MEMIPPNGYLIKALYEWLLDNKLTPHVLIAVNVVGVVVPHSFVKGDTLILNIHPEAVRNLHIDNRTLDCLTKFSGVTEHIYAPIEAIVSIYAKENGVGMTFFPEHSKDDDALTTAEKTKFSPPVNPDLKGKSALTLVNLSSTRKQKLSKTKTKPKSKSHLSLINYPDNEKK
jgi:stringent starvation protein B